MVKRGFLWTSIAVLAVIVGLTAWVMRSKPPAYSGPIEKISIGNSPVFYSLLLMVAEDQGFFAQSGLNVDVKRYEYGALALDHLLKGDVDMAVAADFAFVTKSLDRDDMRIVASIGTSASEEIVARKDRNIAEVSDLKGKKIGVTLKTSSEYTLMRFLLFNHITLDEVTLVDLSPARLVEAISAGEVDAVIIWDKWVREAKKRLGENEACWRARIGQDFYWLAITTKGFVEKKPAAVERFIRAMTQAEAFVKSNKAEAQAIFIRRSGLDPAFVEHAWENSKFRVSLDQGILTAMDGEANWKLQTMPGAMGPAPNYLRFIYMDGLDAVNPRANTILR